MLLISIEQADQAALIHRIERLPCRIGRSRDCELVLAGWRVGRVHAQLQIEPGAKGRAVRIIDAGTLGGTLVNSERITDFGPLSPLDLIEIGGHRLRVQLASEVPAALNDDSPPALSQDTLSWRRLVHRQVLQTLDLRRRDLRLADTDALRIEIRGVIDQLLDESISLPATIDREQLIVDVLDESVGLGPLERLLEDSSISEIMVNAPDEIWVERSGRLQRHASAFTDDAAVRSVIERIVAPLGRRIDESSPMVDARLADGSRVNAVIPPLALRGPALTIRRFARSLKGPQDLIDAGAASIEMFDFLRVCVEQRRNIVISGGTSSGKTTLLNVLSNLIPAGERIITIEDAAELSLRHEHLVQLEGRPPNLEQRGEITIRDLVRNALRMRPDRIVVGECRGGETLDMLQAMNTGHDGSLTTVHANSPRDVISRLEVMTLMAGMDLPVSAIREQVSAAIDVVVHQARFADGSRRITSIMEVTGIESGRVQMQPLFDYRARVGARGVAAAGEFIGCGNVPTFYEGLRASGLVLDLRPFQEVTHGR
jgi:pilus assembly protein CpaF